MRNSPWRLGLVLASVLVVVGCGKKQDQAGGGPMVDPAEPHGTAESPYVIGFSQCAGDEPWREQMDRDIREQAAAHDNIRLIYKDAQSDSTTQQANVAEYVTQGVDLIIISPQDVSLTQAVASAYDAGIPVIVLDRAVTGDKFTCFIGADNRVIGREVGKWVVDRLGGEEGGGNVVELIGLASSTPSADRSEPFHEAIKGTNIKVVYQADMEWKGDIAREKMQAALAANSEPGSIDLVYGANDPAAIQAYYAAKDAGRADEMLFVGVDALPQEGVKAVRDGMLDATFLYPNGAAEAIDLALKILAGQEVPKHVTLGTRLYTKDNVDKGGTPIGG